MRHDRKSREPGGEGTGPDTATSEQDILKLTQNFTMKSWIHLKLIELQSRKKCHVY